MKKFKATKEKTDKLKWSIYLLIGISLLVFIHTYSDWHFISKFIVSVPLVINLLFDIVYLRKENILVSELTFNDTVIAITSNQKTVKRILYPNLKYSIRKRKFDKHKTEIELKLKKGLRFKTYYRIHIKNWDSIFEIENELDTHGVLRVEWKPKTFWAKYWGIFIELFFATAGEGLGGTVIEYQEKSIKEVTQNPIEENKTT